MFCDFFRVFPSECASWVVGTENFRVGTGAGHNTTTKKVKMVCMEMCGTCADCVLLWTRICADCGDDYIAMSVHICSHPPPQLTVREVRRVMASLSEGLDDLMRVFVDRDMGEVEQPELSLRQIRRVIGTGAAVPGPGPAEHPPLSDGPIGWHAECLPAIFARLSTPPT